MPSHDGLGMLLECMRSAWEGPEDAASCACRFLAGVGGSEQEQQLRRLLSFVEALRNPLLERLEGKGARSGDGGAITDASRKRTRCDAESDQAAAQSEPDDRYEAGRNEEARPGPSGQPGTAPDAAPEATQEGMSRAVKGVLLDQDLLACVWGFMLGGHGRQDVRVVGQLSLVCRKWREVGAWDGWWRAIEEDMLPLLWEEEGRQAASSRGRVVEYGRFLEGEKDPLTSQEQGDKWLQGLEGHLEIFDRMDGLQMLSMRGPVSLSEDDLKIAMEFRTDHPETQVKAAAFSAASRDPLRRFSTMMEYLEKKHREEYPSCLCIRVTLRDVRTGRMAVIWEESNHGSDLVENSDDEGWLDVYGGHWLRGQNRFERLSHMGCAYFGLGRVPDKGEGVSEPNVLYRIDPSFRVLFGAVNDDEVHEGSLSLKHFEGILQAVLG